MTTINYGGNQVTGMKTTLGYSKSGHNVFNSFERHKYLQTDFLTSNRAYVFFTSPKLNIPSNIEKLDENKNNAFFYSIDQNSKFKSLIRTYLNGKGFIYPLTNFAENFENSDVVLKTDKFYSTLYGEHVVLPQFYTESISGGEFTINYSESATMRLTLLHKLWIDYIQLVRLNYFQPAKSSISKDVEFVGEIDYTCAVYYFLVGEDGETIKYWSKYTGVFPTNIPYSAFNFEHGGDQARKKLSINYSYSFKRDMEEDIFTDFNHTLKHLAFPEQKTDRLASYNNWAKEVFVAKKSKTSSDGNVSTEYKLIWN